MRESPSDCSLLPALLWLLLSQQQLPLSSLDKETSAAMLVLIRFGLEHAGGSTVALQTALDCVSLALGLPEVQSAVDEEWVAAIVPLVAALLDDDGQPCCSVHSTIINPRRACAARVTVVGSVCVSVCHLWSICSS